MVLTKAAKIYFLFRENTDFIIITMCAINDHIIDISICIII